MNRRGLLGGLGATLLCAPAIVRVASLMPISVQPALFRTYRGSLTAEQVRQIVLHQYQELEQWGLVENSETFADCLEVEMNPWDPNRVDVIIKPHLHEQLKVVANLVERNLRLHL